MKYKCGATYGVKPEIPMYQYRCIYTSMDLSGSLAPDGLGPGSYLSALSCCFCLAVFSFSSWAVCF